VSIDCERHVFTIMTYSYTKTAQAAVSKKNAEIVRLQLQ